MFILLSIYVYIYIYTLVLYPVRTLQRLIYILMYIYRSRYIYKETKSESARDVALCHPRHTRRGHRAEPKRRDRDE